MSSKIVTVVGARPQFIKAATISRLIRGPLKERFSEVLVHTGQHYDNAMSRVFFDEMDIPEPSYNLGLGGGRHGEMTGKMLAAIEEVLLAEKPDWVLIYGDTNSTLAGALAAVKMHIPVAHVEAGLRSFNMKMPEEVNRVLADHASTLLFCPTRTAVDNLAAEGIRQGVHLVGDVMYDASLHFRDKARDESSILERLAVNDGEYVLATCHRQENTDDPARLSAIVAALGEISRELPVVLPLHPRTRGALTSQGLYDKLGDVRITDPVSYLDMVRLEQSAQAIITDSGGVQKEAYFYGVPCLTLRDETEWVETVDLGWNTICGADQERILAAWHGRTSLARRTDVAPYGDGQAARHILDLLPGRA